MCSGKRPMAIGTDCPDTRFVKNRGRRQRYESVLRSREREVDLLFIGAWVDDGFVEKGKYSTYCRPIRFRSD